MAINKRLSDEQLQMILDSYWNFGKVKNAAESAGVSRVTIANLCKTYVLKAFYKSGKLPESLPLKSVFDGDEPLSIGEIYQKALEKFGKRATKMRLEKQLEMLEHIGVCIKIGAADEAKYFFRKTY